jgi:hypothetical protein
VATGAHSVTALIPSFLGIVLGVLGVLAFKDTLRKHVMHLAALLAMLGVFAGAFMGLPKLVSMLRGVELERPAAAIEQSIMALVCAVFVGLCINSFVQARRRRKITEQESS